MGSVIGCVVVSDRGDLYLPECLRALEQAASTAPPMRLAVVDDKDHQLGLAGAVKAAWQIALGEYWDYLLHWEEDFLPLGSLPIAEMAEILDADQHLAQVVLLRPPFSEEEIRAGGIIENRPDVVHTDRTVAGHGIVEHDRLFSLNPCLIPRRVLELGWVSNEEEFTARAKQAGFSFAFYGRTPLVRHVGVVRGTGWSL